ncbi:hypothetical protein C8R44DRAFT_733378 [Mycena epipterygia]|nr:hypothetical protein C8R44DRAFT_733378 [Mycena epipterygia]
MSGSYCFDAIHATFRTRWRSIQNGLHGAAVILVSSPAPPPPSDPQHLYPTRVDLRNKPRLRDAYSVPPVHNDGRMEGEGAEDRWEDYVGISYRFVYPFYFIFIPTLGRADPDVVSTGCTGDEDTRGCTRIVRDVDAPRWGGVGLGARGYTRAVCGGTASRAEMYAGDMRELLLHTESLAGAVALYVRGDAASEDGSIVTWPTSSSHSSNSSGSTWRVPKPLVAARAPRRRLRDTFAFSFSYTPRGDAPRAAHADTPARPRVVRLRLSERLGRRLRQLLVSARSLFAIARGYTSHDSIRVHAGVHARRVFATLRMLVASDGACASYTPAPSLPSYRVNAGVHARRVLAALGTRSHARRVGRPVRQLSALSLIATARCIRDTTPFMCTPPYTQGACSPHWALVASTRRNPNDSAENQNGQKRTVAANTAEARRGILPRLGLVGIQSRLGLAGVNDVAVVGRGFHLEPAVALIALEFKLFTVNCVLEVNESQSR